MRGSGKVPKGRRTATQQQQQQQQLHHQNPQEREEIREYLARLRQIVPGCPKDGKLSRLELIQHVIDYIVQLQDTLLRHPINRLLGEEDPTTFALPATPPVSPITFPPTVHAAVTPHQNFDSTTSTTTTSSSSSSANPLHYHQPGYGTPPPPTRSANSKRPGGSCRRPLGVLSSLNQHRSV